MSKLNTGQKGNTDSWSDNDNSHAPVSPSTNLLRSGVNAGRKAKTAHIPDDWDDDDDEDEDKVENNEKVWQDANSRAPMPQVVISTTSSSAGFGSNPPPPEALSGPLRILKRPKDAAPSLTRSSSNGSTSSQLTLAEREANYQAARDRIFSGQAKANASSFITDTPSDTPASGSGLTTSQISSQSSRISRNPRGPDSSNVTGELPRGFDASRRKNAGAQPALSSQSNTSTS